MKHYKKNAINPYNNKPETKIVNAYAEIDVALPEVDFVFVKNNGVYDVIEEIIEYNISI